MANFAIALSMATGFLSLSQEILWVRIISFIFKGLSQSFAVVLFCFLVGIAIGSAIGKRFCEQHSDLFRTSAIVLAAASILDVSLVLLLPGLMQWSVGFVGVLLLVSLTALLKSIMFPIAHHLGSQQSGRRIGRSVSKVYFGNIIGSTLGPIVMGYLLLDYLAVDNCLLIIGFGTGLLSLLCMTRIRTQALGVTAAATSMLVVGMTIALMIPTNTVPAIALATQRDVIPGSKIEHVIQNRHGIIHTVATPDGKPDTALGGNIYDGRTTVDMRRNYNGLDRALVLLAVHPQPERVLIIGLSTGAWARILSASPRIKNITVVEINPGYLQVIKEYPELVGVLSDPRVEIIIDDGRRWLRRNEDQCFDLIIMNTTFYWRAYATNILSREFMQLVASHLKPGGIAGFNSTFSSDVLETARQVFPFVERRDNYVYGSEKYLSRVLVNAEEPFRELSLNGTPVFPAPAYEPGGRVRDMIDTPFIPHDRQWEGLTPSPGVITDQNLLVEHAHGKLREFMPRFYAAVDDARAWLAR